MHIIQRMLYKTNLITIHIQWTMHVSSHLKYKTYENISIKNVGNIWCLNDYCKSAKHQGSQTTSISHMVAVISAQEFPVCFVLLCVCKEYVLCYCWLFMGPFVVVCLSLWSSMETHWPFCKGHLSSKEIECNNRGYTWDAMEIFWHYMPLKNTDNQNWLRSPEVHKI